MMDPRYGEVTKALHVVRFATQKLPMSVDALVGVELLATTLADKHRATVQTLCWSGVGKYLNALSQT